MALTQAQAEAQKIIGTLEEELGRLPSCAEIMNNIGVRFNKKTLYALDKRYKGEMLLSDEELLIKKMLDEGMTVKEVTKTLNFNSGKTHNHLKNIRIAFSDGYKFRERSEPLPPVYIEITQYKNPEYVGMKGYVDNNCNVIVYVDREPKKLLESEVKYNCL